MCIGRAVRWVAVLASAGLRGGASASLCGGTSPTRAPGWCTGATVLGGSVHEGLIQLGDRRTSQELQRPLHVGSQDLERAGDTRLARGGEAVGIGAADQHGPGAEAEGLHDVAAATDA